MPVVPIRSNPAQAQAQAMPQPDSQYLDMAAAMMHREGKFDSPYGGLSQPDKSWSKTPEQEIQDNKKMEAQNKETEKYTNDLDNVLATQNDNRLMRFLEKGGK